jgi:ribosomal protein S18 acetylase RimI-like enzyme
MIIRRLGPADARLGTMAIRRIKLDGAEDGPSEAMMADRLSDSGRILLVVEKADEPIGYALGYRLERVDGVKPMLFLYEVEVSAAHRRRGIGRALVEEMKRIARDERVLKMWVETNVSNKAANRLYRALGGEQSGEPSAVYTWRSASLDA